MNETAEKAKEALSYTYAPEVSDDKALECYEEFIKNRSEYIENVGCCHR